MPLYPNTPNSSLPLRAVSRRSNPAGKHRRDKVKHTGQPNGTPIPFEGWEPVCGTNEAEWE